MLLKIQPLIIRCNFGTRLYFFFCLLELFHFQDEEDVKAIGRLFADVGDSYVELIATGMLPQFYYPPLLF